MLLCACSIRKSLAVAPDNETNLWQSIQRLPPVPGTYRVMLPSGRMVPAAWLNDRWWERNQEINPVAWQRLEPASASGGTAPAPRTPQRT